MKLPFFHLILFLAAPRTSSFLPPSSLPPAPPPGRLSHPPHGLMVTSMANPAGQENYRVNKVLCAKHRCVGSHNDVTHNHPAVPTPPPRVRAPAAAKLTASWRRVGSPSTAWWLRRATVSASGTASRSTASVSRFRVIA